MTASLLCCIPNGCKYERKSLKSANSSTAICLSKLKINHCILVSDFMSTNHILGKAKSIVSFYDSPNLLIGKRHHAFNHIE